MIQKTMYAGLANLKVNGVNFKRDETRREWNAVATGGSYKSNRNETMIEVKEVVDGRKQTRWINLSTFTGTIGPYIFERGERKNDGAKTIDSIPVSA